MTTLKDKIFRLLKWSEKYTKTDMIYASRSGFWLLIGQSIGTLVSLILTLVFANYLSKEVFGIYKYILSTVGFLTVFSLSGMNTVITRAVAQGYDGTFKYSLLLQLKWTLPQFLSLLALSIYYYLQLNTPYAIAFLVTSIFGPLSTVANSFNAFLHGKQDFRTSTFYNAGSAILYGTLMVSVVFYAPKIVWLIATYFIFHALINIFFCFRTLKKYPPINPTLRDEDVSYAKHLSIMNVIGSAAQQIDNIIVYHLLGPAQLAIFTFSTILPDRIRTIFNTLASAALPKLSEKEGGSWKSIKFKMIQLGILATFIILLYVLTAHYFYNLFFPQYVSSIWYSQIYVFSLLVLPGYISLPTLQAIKSQKELYVINVIIPIFKIVITGIAIFLWGILGAIIAKVILFLALLILSALPSDQK